MNSDEEFERLLAAVEGTEEARRAHVRNVLIIGSGSEPLETPPEVADREWFAEYRRLRAAEDAARDELDDHFRRRFGLQP